MSNKFLVKRPLITEKATLLGKLGKYMFLVADKANKSEVKKIIEKEYKVHIEKVNIITAKSKERRLGKSIGIRPGYKKAIITLREGEKLDILPQ